jgi:hypothetical protein
MLLSSACSVDVCFVLQQRPLVQALLLQLQSFLMVHKLWLYHRHVRAYSCVDANISKAQAR